MTNTDSPTTVPALMHDVCQGCLYDPNNQSRHDAEGWLCDTDGAPIMPVCKSYAEKVIAEYQVKLGEDWTFQI